MPSPRIRVETLVLEADGKRIEVKKPSRMNFDLNKALNNPADFQQFVADPAAFAQRFDLTIDPEVSTALRTRLSGFESLAAARAISEGTVQATVWAIASPAYSFATSKIAFAF
jgi:hypothetical protein